MKIRTSTLVLVALVLMVLLVSVPASLQYVREHGELYLFSPAFFEDIPKRLLGPGKFRFVLQPALAIFFGIRGGLVDARAGGPAYLYGLLFNRHLRGELARSGVLALANLMLMGILVDSVCQWLILGISHPGAALVVGPTLIVFPYTVARALTNRLSTLGSCVAKRKKSGH